MSNEIRLQTFHGSFPLGPYMSPDLLASCALGFRTPAIIGKEVSTVIAWLCLPIIAAVAFFVEYS